MPRLYGRRDAETYPGVLTIEPLSSDFVDVFYTPSRERIEYSGSELSTEDSADYRVKLLEIDGRNGRLTMLPTRTTGRKDVFLKPKYNQVKRITIAAQYYVAVDFYGGFPANDEDVMALLEELPSCFVKDYDWGLGLRQDYRFIIQEIERLSPCTEVLITDQGTTRIDLSGDTFQISVEHFEELRKAIGRNIRQIQDRTHSINQEVTRNGLGEMLRLPAGSGNSSRSRATRFSAEVALMSPIDKENAVRVVTENARSIAVSQPDELATLTQSIERVALETLIDDFEKLLRARAQEREWQSFLNEKPFVLSLAFGYPVINVQGQASVGGRKLSGMGDKVADFLVKNSLTNNCAIVEIKKPTTRLLNSNPSRNGVYTPSSDLVGAINQALDQKYQFDKQVAQFKENSQVYDIASYSVHCCLLVGYLPSGQDQLKSFELFRGNSKDVEIVTFDELLEKLKQFWNFLTSTDSEPSPAKNTP